MKDTTGFLVPDFVMNSAASSSAVPPISPIMMMPSVCIHKGYFALILVHSCSTKCRGGVLTFPCNGIALRQLASGHRSHLRVSHKLLQAVHKVGAIEGVSSNAHHSALPQAFLGCLEYGLVGESARSGHNANLARRVDVTLQSTSTA